ncbi:MAG: two component transcriptional regulator, LuxR family [Candidatus Eremiobacteraeota bacterium]|nr:two component transcriptional regulator, LuxR family [Candidatus Eremiobacteraeota bacterium]
MQAPAGFGKTTGVHAALAGAADVAWYDAQPWEAGAFVAPLIARVRTLRPDVGRSTLTLSEADADVERLGATFAEELRHVDAPLRIVVDDAHVLGPQFGAFARELARRMPPSVRLVLLARGALDVGLPEAVAAGRGAFVDAEALRFDRSRVCDLAGQLGIPIDAARADALIARSQGWPIAVALALRAAGSSDALLDELVARRIDALPPEDRALLDATLAYEMIEPEVAAPDDATSLARLTLLADDATLVARVRTGFRVHPLVREALARRLDERALAERHAIAARAYLVAERLRPAVFHLNRAHDIAADVAFLRAHAASAVASGLVDGIRAALARIRAAPPASPPGLVPLVEGLLAKARGDDGRSAFAAAASGADANHDGALAFEARLQIVEADLAHGDAVAPQRIDDLLARAAPFGPVAQVKAAVRAGWADAVDGRFAQVLARLDALGGTDPALLADVAPLAAYAHVALGDFERGEQMANALIEAWAASDDVVRYAGALGWAARFALLRGETTAAYELAREAERIARPFALRAQAAAMHATLGEAALHVGDLELARREARAAVRTAGAAWYARDAARARTIATRIAARANALDGDPAAALAATVAVDPLSLADAATFAALAREAGAPARRTRARAALSGATPVDGDDAVALLAAAEVLDFLDAIDGHDVETTLRSGPFDGLIARRAQPVRLAHLGVALRGLSRGSDSPDAYAAAYALATAGGMRFETQIAARMAPRLDGRGTPPRVEATIEALTAREQEILGLLATGLTNREIAQRLILSARTVETHVARVTGKLGVNSRARAVARAIALGLVPSPASA